MDKAGYIYTLSDPDSAQVMYVGRAIDPNKRLVAHCRADGGTKKDEWIRQLLAAGKFPQMEVVDECDAESIQFAERQWIAFYSIQNKRITNTMSVPISATLKRPAILRRLVHACPTCKRCACAIDPDNARAVYLFDDGWHWWCDPCMEQINSQPIEPYDPWWDD